MPQLVNMHLRQSGLLRVHLQIPIKGMRRQLLTRLSSQIVPSPQRRLRLQSMHPAGGLQVITQRSNHRWIPHFKLDIVTPLHSAPYDQDITSQLAVIPSQADNLFPPASAHQKEQQQRIVALANQVSAVS